MNVHDFDNLKGIEVLMMDAGTADCERCLEPAHNFCRHPTEGQAWLCTKCVAKVWQQAVQRL
jgi:hypothetical protein